MKNPTAIDPAMQSCIKACEDCHRICLTMAMRYCLEMGGKHVAPEHFRLMLSALKSARRRPTSCSVLHRCIGARAALARKSATPAPTAASSLPAWRSAQRFVDPVLRAAAPWPAGATEELASTAD